MKTILEILVDWGVVVVIALLIVLFSVLSWPLMAEVLRCPN